MEKEDSRIALAIGAADFAERSKETAATLAHWKTTGELPSGAIGDISHLSLEEQHSKVWLEMDRVTQDVNAATSWNDVLRNLSRRYTKTFDQFKETISVVVKWKEEGQNIGSLVKEAGIVKMYVDAMKLEMVNLKDLDHYLYEMEERRGKLRGKIWKLQCLLDSTDIQY